MATKAERFKAQAARDANPPKAKRPARPRRDSVVDTSKPGVSATDRRARRGPSGSRNTSKRAGTKGGAALEDTITGEPSRKSTRRSTGGAKRTANLELRAKRRTSSAKARASRSTAKKSPAKPTAKKAPAAKKTPAKKAPAKKAPAKKAPAKKAPAKKAPAKKAPAIKR